MANDPNLGWSVQSDRPYVDGEQVPDDYAIKGELPDPQALAEQGVNTRAFFANLPVVT